MQAITTEVETASARCSETRERAASSSMTWRSSTAESEADS